MRTGETHIDPLDLAQCADGTLPEEEARSVRDHLAECRSCMAAYVDAVRYRAAWLADTNSFRLEGADRSMLGTAGPVEPVGTKPSGRPPALGALALVGAVAVFIVVSVQFMGPSGTPTLGFQLDRATLEATAWSTAGGLVLPGTEARAADPPPDRRSGAGSSSLELEAELKTVIDAYEAGGRDAESSARVVASLLANGDVTAANDYGREALQTHPDDVRLLVFAASARIRSNDLPEAEQLLRRAIRRAPRDPIVALDLGMVLCAQGRGAEAKRWFERAAASKVAPIAARARRELQNCGVG